MKISFISRLIGSAVAVTLTIMALAMGLMAKPRVSKKPFGKTGDGKSVEIFTLTNSKGAEAKIITYGGAVVSLKVPDKRGDG